MGFLTFVGVALLLVLLVVAGIVVYCGRWRYPGPRRKPTGKYPVFSKFKMPLHISHRGGSESFPANTMVAYRGAVYQYGTSGIEIDLHLSADGEVVLMHDRTVESTTDGHGIVSDFSVAQLKRLDAAYWFTQDDGQTYPLRGKGVQVPTFIEVLDEFEKVENVFFFLDFKHDAAIPVAMRILEERNLMDRVMMGAVLPSHNQMVLQARPVHIPVAVDFKTMIEIMVLYWIGLLWVHPSPHDVLGFFVNHRTAKLLNKRLFKELHSRGSLIALFGPGIDSKEDQRKFIEMGADLLVTDRPDNLRAVLDEMHATDKLSRL